MIAAAAAARSPRGRRPAGATVPPCARCGTAGGTPRKGHEAPARYSGGRLADNEARVRAAAARLAPLGLFSMRRLAAEAGLGYEATSIAVARLRARMEWPHVSPCGRAPEAPAGPAPPPEYVAAAARAARPFGPARRPTDRLRLAWRRYRKGEPRPLLIAAGLLSRRKWEGDES